MTPQEHYRKADQLITAAGVESLAFRRAQLTAEAQVHATLATAVTAHDRAQDDEHEAWLESVRGDI